MKSDTAIRAGLCLVLLLALEIACRTGAVSHFTMVPPSEMVAKLFQIILQPKVDAEMVLTFGSVAIAGLAAIVVGFTVGITLHSMPRLRRSVDPYLMSYYSVPIFVFYPMFIVFFGLNRWPIITIGFLLAVAGMVSNTLDGLDRVPPIQIKSARIFRMNRLATIWFIVLPSAFPYLLSGIKFAVAFAFAGTLGAEFILANDGLGYAISYAYNDFDNPTMYALIVLVLIAVSVVNAFLFGWERRVLERRGLG